MRYLEFEHTISPARMGRYLTACGGDTKKAMTLYRQNLRLSQELFTVISCLEIALRNAIDRHYIQQLGSDWLRDSAASGGTLNNGNCRITVNIINDAVRKLNHRYTHFKLLAEMDFGFWRYLFAQPQFHAGGQTLLHIFPAKPRSSPSIQYNHTFVFNQLAQINDIRNRIAHHEPICFSPSLPQKNTNYVQQHYVIVLQLFQWMQIDESALLYGLDHINTISQQIDSL